MKALLPVEFLCPTYQPTTTFLKRMPANSASGNLSKPSTHNLPHNHHHWQQVHAHHPPFAALTTHRQTPCPPTLAPQSHDNPPGGDNEWRWVPHSIPLWQLPHRWQGCVNQTTNGDWKSLFIIILWLEHYMPIDDPRPNNDMTPNNDPRPNNDPLQQSKVHACGGARLPTTHNLQMTQHPQTAPSTHQQHPVPTNSQATPSADKQEPAHASNNAQGQQPPSPPPTDDNNLPTILHSWQRPTMDDNNPQPRMTSAHGRHNPPTYKSYAPMNDAHPRTMHAHRWQRLPTVIVPSFHPHLISYFPLILITQLTFIDLHLCMSIPDIYT